jgi:hypothetical protein
MAVRWPLLSALILILAGCVEGPRPDGPDLVGLRARLGSADVISASLLVQLTPAKGEGELFTLRLWRAGDGAVRLRAQKLDVDFLDALVRPDGAYEAVLPRERVATTGKLGSPDDPPLLNDLQLLLSDLRDGPLPRTAVPTGEARRLAWKDGDWSAELDLAADGLPSAKRLSAGGTVQRDVTYARWQAYEGLTRPSQVRLRIPGDDGVTAIRLKSLDTPPVISAERMALRVPDGVERVEPAVFSRRMLGPAPE